MTFMMDLFRRPLFPLVSFAQRQFSVSSFLLGEKIPKKKVSSKKEPLVVPSAAALAAVAAAANPSLVPVHPGHNPRGTNKRKHPKRIHRHTIPAPFIDWGAAIDWSIDRNSVLSYQPHTSHHWQDWKMLRDVKRRAYLERDGRARKMLSLIHRSDRILPKELNEEAKTDVNKMVRDSKYTRIVDRCMFTSRPRGLAKRWRLSRIVWRDIADHNKLSGVIRADWMYRNDKTYFYNQAPDLHDTLTSLDPLQGGRATYYTELENKYYWSGYAFPPIVYNQNIFKEQFVYPPPLPENTPRLRNTPKKRRQNRKRFHLLMQPWETLQGLKRFQRGISAYGRPDYNEKHKGGEGYVYWNHGIPSGPVTGSDVPLEQFNTEDVD